MPINDNGDIIRAVGFVAVYGAYLEDRIAELMELTETHIQPIKNKSNPPVSDQVKHLIKSFKMLFAQVRDYHSKDNDFKQVVGTLSSIEAFLKERNHIIHSVLISNSAGIVTQKNRRANTKTEIDSKMVIDFANEILEIQSQVSGLKFPIRRLISAISNQKIN